MNETKQNKKKTKTKSNKTQQGSKNLRNNPNHLVKSRRAWLFSFSRLNFGFRFAMRYLSETRFENKDE